MRRAILLLACSPLAVIACTVSANVGGLDVDSRDAAEASSPNDASSDAPADAPAEEDVADATAFDAGCGIAFPQEASFVDVAVTTAVPPSYGGGTIAPGTYALVAMRAFMAGTTGTMQVRETMVLRGSAEAGARERLTEARNATGSFKAYPLHGETSTWQAPSGPSFFETPECPTKSFQTTGRYEASGDTLAIFDDVNVIERTYRRTH